MILKMKRILALFQYPHWLYGKAIKGVIAALSNGDAVSVIDAPCGNGEVSLLLSNIPKANVKAYDLSAESIEHAQNSFHRHNLSFEVMDIYKLFSGPVECDVYCMVNSLFLMPDPEGLLLKISDSLKPRTSFILIVPNIHSENYLRFKNQNPGVNTKEYSLPDLKTSLQSKGFNVESELGLARVTRYGRRDLEWMSIGLPFFMLLLDYIKRIFNLGEPGYYLIHSIKQ